MIMEQKLFEIYLKTLEDLIQENMLDEAIKLFQEIDDKTKAGISQDIILITGGYNQVKTMFKQGLLDNKEYLQMTAKTRYALSETAKGLPRRWELNARILGLPFSMAVSKDANLEAIIGGRDNTFKMDWLHKAVKNAAAVCRIVYRNSNKRGTGFLTQDGRIFTNNHVIATPEQARNAFAEFNFESDINGQIKTSISYEFDPNDFITSPVEEFDFTRLKLVDRNDAPLKQWGFVTISDQIPAKDEPVVIIQHPLGDEKKIAITDDKIVGQNKQWLYYVTATEKGSSGSPVFNMNWEVIALHHAGLNEKSAEGGLDIDGRGTIKPANEGILFRDILQFIKAEGK